MLSKSQITFFRNENINEFQEPRPTRPVSYLFPENLGQRATPMTAHTKQADKHDEKQGNVSNEAGYEIGRTALDVETYAGQLGRGRCSAELGVVLGHDFKYWN